MVAGEDPNEDPPPNDPPPNDPPPNDDPPKDNDGEFSGKKFNSWGVKLWLKFGWLPWFLFCWTNFSFSSCCFCSINLKFALVCDTVPRVGDTVFVDKSGSGLMCMSGSIRIRGFSLKEKTKIKLADDLFKTKI